MIKECFIMRGMPGSGKSTYVRNEILGYHNPVAVYSADDYHMTQEGYRYIAANAHLAHKTCFQKFVSSIELELPYVVVDNTNTTPLEIEPYRRFAEVNDYLITIIWCDATFELCMRRQTHNVPLKTMLNMWHNLQKPMPKFWNLKWVNTQE